ncbi:hypothetical protein H9L39_05272 [Fusarium oxysporum f. sp. albedinis]|nr:hypothetical protein H9L39_05272 [Fusarium oxysporum f. sp. albedinis]
MAIPENFKSTITITHVTTATAIVDIDGAKFITDPIFDEAPQSHDRSHVAGLKPGEFFLTLQEGPAISIKQLPIIDCKLSDHPGTCAIEPWQTLEFQLGGDEWSITDIPCVHVPGGQVTGFLLHKTSFGTSPDGRQNVGYFTGDTAFIENEFRKLHEKYHVVVAITNLGQAMLPSPKSTTGFVQITMGGEDAVRMMEILDADIIVPMYFESWTHFTQGRKALEEAFTSGGLGDKIKWLPSGKEVNVI